MKKILKWAGFSVVALAVLAVAVVFGASEYLLRVAPGHVEGRPIAGIAGDAARGHAVAVRYGCLDCHGANLQGRMFDDIPGLLKAYAPNLTLATARQTGAGLERAIRHGVGADGRPLWIMPSAAYSHLTDQETADLIAMIRAAPEGGGEQPRFQLRPKARIGAILGLFKSEPAVIAAHGNPPLADFGPATAEGRGLARACVECHGPALDGTAAPIVTPDLMIAAAYDPEDFRRLMHTGIASGDRKVGLMTDVARSRFASMSDTEVAALQAYLKARADHKTASE